MAELLAIVLTFDGAVGSVAEVVDGVYTGREGGPFTYREGKAQAIRELAEREGIDLAASLGVLATRESDLPMLRLVGHPVAVNPDKELRASRARRGGRSCASSTLGAQAARGAAARPRAGGAGGVAAVARPPRRCATR